MLIKYNLKFPFKIHLNDLSNLICRSRILKYLNRLERKRCGQFFFKHHIILFSDHRRLLQAELWTSSFLSHLLFHFGGITASWLPSPGASVSKHRICPQSCLPLISRSREYIRREVLCITEYHNSDANGR